MAKIKIQKMSQKLLKKCQKCQKLLKNLNTFFESTNFNFNVIAISKTRITKYKATINNIDLKNYS